MTPETVLEALAIPEAALQPRRVPKKLVAENGATTARDRTAILDGIGRLVWEATLKPGQTGAPVFQDALAEYSEIAVLTAEFRAGARVPRLLELIHRAIPYPVALIAGTVDEAIFSLAHIRRSQAESEKTVLDSEVMSVALGDGAVAEDEFLISLAVQSLPRLHLRAFYQGWIDRVTALIAARMSGVFRLADSPQAAGIQAGAIADIESIQRRVSELRAQGRRETQMNRRVELNLEIKRLEESVARIREQLQ